MSSVNGDLITTDPLVRGGKPVIRGTRVAVVDILDSLAAGESVDSILEEWSYLNREQVQAAIAYAADLQRKLTGTTSHASG